MGKTKRLVAAAAIGVTSLGALALQVTTSGAGGVVARAELRNQANVVVGEVVFKKHGHEIIGIAEVQLPVATTEFRGFHIHANNVDNNPVDGDPADGCVGDFTSVDGHWDVGGHSHGAHTGDLPVLMRDGSGHAEAEFVIGKFQPGDIIGRAVVVHAGADNYANIPTRYQSNASATPGPDGTTLGNGDAGGRYACGVIVSSADDGDEG
jgi:Cu-Zn family superoxide dismutase